MATDYDRQAGKSISAVCAEALGLKTASALAKMLGRSVQAQDVAEHYTEVARHGTSARFNRTQYYYEPVAEMLAKRPLITIDDIEAGLRSALDRVLATPSCGRDRCHVDAMRDLLDRDRDFCEHVERSRARLEMLYCSAQRRTWFNEKGHTVQANVSFKEFEYCEHERRRKFARSVSLEGIDVHVKGDWAQFVHNGSLIRKKISGNAFDLQIIDDPED